LSIVLGVVASVLCGVYAGLVFTPIYNYFVRLAAVYLPDLAAVLKVADPGGAGWGVESAMSLLPVAIGQILNGSRVG